MKKEIVRLLSLVGVGMFLATGCHTGEVVVTGPAGGVVVSSAPPPPRREVIVGVAPTPRHAWVEGFWTFRGGRWVWIPGHWERGPRVGARWVSGSWVHRPRGWVWVSGHWG